MRPLDVTTTHPLAVLLMAFDEALTRVAVRNAADALAAERARRAGWLREAAELDDVDLGRSA